MLRAVRNILFRTYMPDTTQIIIAGTITAGLYGVRTWFLFNDKKIALAVLLNSDITLKLSAMQCRSVPCPAVPNVAELRCAVLHCAVFNAYSIKYHCEVPGTT